MRMHLVPRMDLLPARLVGNPWVFAIVTTTLLLVVPEVGYRLGRRLFLAHDEVRRSQIAVIQGAALGLLGLLLGFTFSMAVARYEERRMLVVKEANAIGTTWLRASTLPEERRGTVRALLRDYVDTRLRTYAESRDPVRLADGLRRSAAIQSELWQHADAVAAETPTAITASFITTLNELIDVDAERVAAGRNRIPSGVWLILVVVASFGCGLGAYGAGAHGIRLPLATVLLPLLISVVMLLIYDMSHERQGMIGISQQPLVDLQNSFQTEVTSSRERSTHQ